MHTPHWLANHRGKWLLLVSHPADLTATCTSGFMAVARHSDVFGALGAWLPGASIDSTPARIAWVRTIRERFGANIRVPIIGYISMQVAPAFGRIHHGASDTRAVRATVFIDPDGILRAMINGPMSSGRSTAELPRLQTAMQTADRAKVATPQGWDQGQPVIVPPEQTVAEADARAGQGFATVDWQFSRKMPG